MCSVAFYTLNIAGATFDMPDVLSPSCELAAGS